MAPFVLPPYPYDRLDPLKRVAADHDGGIVDLSIGTPGDPPPATVTAALADAGAAAQGYPPSIGTPAYRTAAASWLNELVGLDLGPNDVRATIGSKEFVAGLPAWLHLKIPDRDTVLYPAVSYPSYAMGAELAGLRAVPVAVDADWRIDLSTVDPADAARALCLWVNSPGNPAGGLDDLGAAAEWGRSHGVPVFSDECYIEFIWDGPPRSILEHGLDGVVAVHSLSKRSNLAGGRAGVYAGDPELLHFLGEIRKHAGFMPPGPTQAAAIAAFGDRAHVDAQRERYAERLRLGRRLLMAAGADDCPLPAGGFYLWAAAPDGDAWAFTEMLAREAGMLVSPGEFYGPAGAGHVRAAVIRSTDQLALAADRLGVSLD